MTTVIIDNYDSFTYNLAQYVAMAGGKPVVLKNDVPFQRVARAGATRFIFSPGPGSVDTPGTCGVTFEILQRYGGTVPILGVCLGHQAIGKHFGARIVPCPEVRHGKISLARRRGRCQILRGMPQAFPVMRYHSFAVEESSLHGDLAVVGQAEDDGVVMAIEHRRLPISGVQFHPESIGTPRGLRIIRNFINQGPRAARSAA